jgi:cyanophycin synthetase
VVLNADDEHCLRMADYSSAKHVWYVTLNPKHDLVREHIRSGGKAVAVEQGINGQMITMYDRGAHLPLLWTHLVPATLEGKALHNVQNAMFAAAMAYAMGVKLDDIRHGLRTFDTTFFQSPGRMNVYDGLGFKVILDYGHNAAAVQAMCSLVDNLVSGGAMAPGGKRVCVLSCPGDRRNEDIRNVAQIAARSFDYIVVRRDDSTRGRGAREVPELLAGFLRDTGFPDDRILVTETEIEAVPIALDLCRPGDLLLVFCDKVSRTWKQIVYHHTQIGGATPATPPAESGGTGAPSPAREELEEEEASLRSGLVRDERGVRLARSSEEND